MNEQNDQPSNSGQGAGQPQPEPQTTAEKAWAAGQEPVAAQPEPPRGTQSQAEQPAAQVGNEQPAASSAQAWANYYAQQQRPAKKSNSFLRGLGLGSGAALGIGLVSGLLAIPALVLPVMLFGGLLGSIDEEALDASMDLTTVVGDEFASERLLAIPVAGVIMGDDSGADPFGVGTYGYDIADTIDSLGDDEFEGIILEMDTPGGTIFGAKAISDAAERYTERTGKPVYAYVKGISASGGVYAMSGATEIIADAGTFIGSIGVIFGPISRYTDVTAVDGGLFGGGVEAGRIDEFYISAGKGKDFVNPFRDMTEEERNHYQSVIDVEYTNFVDHVATRRDIPVDRIRNEMGAFLFSPEQAVENGLIDQKMGQNEAYEYFMEAAGLDIEDAAIVRQGEPGFWSIFGASARSMNASTNIPGYTSGIPLDAGASTSMAGICVGGPTVLAYHGDPNVHCRR